MAWLDNGNASYRSDDTGSVRMFYPVSNTPALGFVVDLSYRRRHFQSVERWIDHVDRTPLQKLELWIHNGFR